MALRLPVKHQSLSFLVTPPSSSGPLHIVPVFKSLNHITPEKPLSITIFGYRSWPVTLSFNLTCFLISDRFIFRHYQDRRFYFRLFTSNFLFLLNHHLSHKTPCK